MPTPRLGWIFGPGTCAWFDVRAALMDGADAPEVRRVVCAAPTAACECPIQRVRWGYDAAAVLRQFARETALDVIRLWDAPPVVLRYLKTGDESIRVIATDTAWRRAKTSAWAAAAAADGIANDTARYAAWAVGDAAANGVGAAVKSAVRTAAYDDASRRQSRRLARLLNSGRKLYGQRSMP